MSIDILYGDEDLLIEEKKRDLLSKIAPIVPESLSPTLSIEDLYTTFATGSLFAETKYFVVKSPKFLSQSLDKKEAKTFEDALNALKMNGHKLLIYTYGSIDQRKKSITLLKKMGTLHPFKALQDWEQDKVHQWIQKRLSQLGKNCDQEAILAIEAVGGTQLSILASFINTLVTYIGDKKSLSKSDINDLSANTSQSIFNFSEAMKKKQYQPAITALKQLLHQGQDPIQLMGVIGANVRLYLQLLSAQKEGLSQAEMASKLRKNPYFIKLVLNEIRSKHDPKHLQKTLVYLHEQDVKIKSGKLSSTIACELSTHYFFKN